METIKKTTVGILRGMEINETKVFPIKERTYIQNLKSYRLKEREPGKRWSLETRGEEVIVTRTQ